MLANVGAQNGILQINAFVENDDFYFYDPGYRFQGEAQHHILNAVNGFDHKEMMVNFAFSGKMYDGDFTKVNDPLLHGKHAASIWILLNRGVIASIEGLEEISHDSRIVFNGQRFTSGQEVTEAMLGTEKQVLTRLYAVCETREELVALMDKIHHSVQVYDQTGKSMVVDMLGL